MSIYTSAVAVLCAALLDSAAAHAAGCDKSCLEAIGTAYRMAYRQHDVTLAPFAKHVRFTENNVEMAFPDGTWDTVSAEIDAPLILADPQTGQVGIYTSILQREAQGFLAVRLRVREHQITEVEQIVATRRNLSGPPTPMGDATEYRRDPALSATVPAADRVPRALLAQQADGYFATLQYNTGEIRGARFAKGAVRNETGLLSTDIEQGFRTGRYRYNNRVRDRDCFLKDEERGFVMCRGFIDHKGVLDEYTLTDGTPARSNYQEPQSWGFLEAFKITTDGIVAVEATFSAQPYFMRSPWTLKPDAVYDASRAGASRTGAAATVPASR